MVSVHEIPLFCNSSILFIKFSCKVLEESTEMRAFLLQISKAFERVWHRGPIAKLRSIAVEGNLSNWFILLARGGYSINFE